MTAIRAAQASVETGQWGDDFPVGEIALDDGTLARATLYLHRPEHDEDNPGPDAEAPYLVLDIDWDPPRDTDTTTLRVYVNDHQIHPRR